MDLSVKFVPNQEELYFSCGRYRRLVGKLNYLIIICLNIVFIVSTIIQFLNSSCLDHWNAVLQILKYVKKTPNKCLIYEVKINTQINGYSF